MSLIKTLLHDSPNAPKPQPKGRKSTEERPERLTGRHFPVLITPAPGAKRKRPSRDCGECNVSKKRRTGYKRKKKTSYWCPECNKPLCVLDCFKAYHTLANYRAHLLPGNTGSSTESDSNPEE
ncbi:hypothetical protein FSP39_000665 [Pinctada imbricata]|uniref:PiggyBac transposable element-derived protein 4 C-terminal zinc-finger domain-containing protein n=1 Tax=Pinctada imbricata TaxID=66713 RepID=A0AA89BXR8_PINIB|nr:hypothetical protein FSP39_000665 [Pinctada imbricata]